MAGTPAEHETTPADDPAPAGQDDARADHDDARADHNDARADHNDAAVDHDDAARADYAADRAHALRTMFPRRVAMIPEAPLSPESAPSTLSADAAPSRDAGPGPLSPHAPPGLPGPAPMASTWPPPGRPAGDTAAAGGDGAVPSRFSVKRAAAVAVTGVALVLALSATVFVMARATTRSAQEDTSAGVAVPLMIPSMRDLPTASATPGGSSGPSAASPDASSPAPSTDATAPTASGTAAPGPHPAPPPGTPGAGGTNLALGGKVSVSGVEGHPWKAANAVDGDLSTRWSSAFAETGWLVVDLGATREVREVEIVWEHAYAIAYRVETSTDGKKWVPIFGTTAGTGGTVTIRQAATARYVRLYCTKRSGRYGYSVLELLVR